MNLSIWKRIAFIHHFRKQRRRGRALSAWRGNKKNSNRNVRPEKKSSSLQLKMPVGGNLKTPNEHYCVYLKIRICTYAKLNAIFIFFFVAKSCARRLKEFCMTRVKLRGTNLFEFFFGIREILITKIRARKVRFFLLVDKRKFKTSKINLFTVDSNNFRFRLLCWRFMLNDVNYYLLFPGGIHFWERFANSTRRETIILFCFCCR